MREDRWWMEKGKEFEYHCEKRGASFKMRSLFGRTTGYVPLVFGVTGGPTIHMP